VSYTGEVSVGGAADVRETPGLKHWAPPLSEGGAQC